VTRERFLGGSIPVSLSPLADRAGSRVRNEPITRAFCCARRASVHPIAVRATANINWRRLFDDLVGVDEK
jgi:hypothetical protein